MLQQTYSRRYWELIDAGYKPEQIITCPRGDPCWCELSIAVGKEYVKNCGLAERSHEVDGGVSSVG